MVRSIYRANKSQCKEQYLVAFLDDFEVFKLEIRLATDLRLMRLKKHAKLASSWRA